MHGIGLMASSTACTVAQSKGSIRSLQHVQLQETSAEASELAVKIDKESPEHCAIPLVESDPEWNRFDPLN